MSTMVTDLSTLLTPTVKRRLQLLVDYVQPMFVATREGVEESEVRRDFRTLNRELGLYNLDELRTWWKENRRNYR